MNATALNVTVTEPLKEYVEAQIRERGYSSASEYVRELIREDQRRHAVEKLELLLLEGGGLRNTIEATPEFWRRQQREFARRHNLPAR